MTLQEIDEMAIIEPYCFENEQEEQWYKVGIREGADAAIKQLGWHPASELPPVDENGNSQDVIVICGTMHLLCDLPRWSSVVGGVWGDEDVKWWCYPPKED